MDVFSMNFGRTEVIIGASKAKFCRESFGEVRFCVAAQKPGKNDEKRVFETEKNVEAKCENLQIASLKMNV